MIKNNCFVSVGSDKIIWGIGKTIAKSKRDALSNVKGFVRGWRYFGKEKGDEERQELLDTIKFKTYQCSDEDYYKINHDGTSEKTKYKIRNGVLSLISNKRQKPHKIYGTK